MGWMKVDAARKYAGGVGRKILYKAVASGQLRAARIGAGRSLLFSTTWIDEWLTTSAAARKEEDGASWQGNPTTQRLAGSGALRLVERR